MTYFAGRAKNDKKEYIQCMCWKKVKAAVNDAALSVSKHKRGDNSISVSVSTSGCTPSVRVSRVSRVRVKVRVRFWDELYTMAMKKNHHLPTTEP